MKWADYCVKKLSKSESGLIENIIFSYDLNVTISNELIEKDRNWMVAQVNAGKTFCAIKREESGAWKNIGNFSYNGGLFSWFGLPRNIPKRKTFVSYYHKDDQEFRAKFENLFGDLIVSKSVENNEINSENSDEYIKQLIQKDFLADTTVLVVLIGAKTKCRKHVDWEISGAISTRVGGNSGLLGILLPSHPDYGTGQATYDLMPKRLADNFKSGYAIIKDWTADRILMQNYIEEAYSNKSTKSGNRNNSRIQMSINICE